MCIVIPSLLIYSIEGEPIQLIFRKDKQISYNYIRHICYKEATISRFLILNPTMLIENKSSKLRFNCFTIVANSVELFSINVNIRWWDLKICYMRSRQVLFEAHHAEFLNYSVSKYTLPSFQLYFTCSLDNYHLEWFVLDFIYFNILA